MIEFTRRRRRRAEINMVSMIDIMLVLIIFFMVSGSMEQIEVLPVDPPFAESGDEINQGPIVIVLGSHEEVLVDDELLMPEEVVPAVKKYLKANPERYITVKADARMKAEGLIAMLDQIHEAGGKNLTIATQLP